LAQTKKEKTLINWLKRILFKKYLNWYLKRFKASGESLDFQMVLQNLKHVLIILPDYWDLEAIQNIFIKPLYQIFGEKTTISTFEKKTLRKEDSTWLGLPKKQYLQFFQQVKIDMIVDLSDPDDLFSTYVCSKLSAPLKITLQTHPFEQVYNLSIRAKTEDLPQRRIEVALQYLAKLKNSSTVQTNGKVLK